MSSRTCPECGAVCDGYPPCIGEGCGEKPCAACQAEIAERREVARAKEAEAIVRELAECDPVTSGEDFEGWICELCRVHVEQGEFAKEQHADSCPWLRAVAWCKP